MVGQAGKWSTQYSKYTGSGDKNEGCLMSLTNSKATSCILLRIFEDNAGPSLAPEEQRQCGSNTLQELHPDTL